MEETKFLDKMNDKIVEVSAYIYPIKIDFIFEDIKSILKLLVSKVSDYNNRVETPISGALSFNVKY